MRSLSLVPGAERRYDASEWCDALVFVARGELELVCRSGGTRRFGRGTVLWLSPLPLRALRNRGDEHTVLVAISRRETDEFRVSRLSSSYAGMHISTKEGLAMNGGFVWFNLSSSDPMAAGRFYEQLLGWQVQRDGEGPSMIAGENGPWAGIGPEAAGEPAWVPYVQVPDVDEATKRALDLGASMVQETMEGPAGRFSTILDPGGAPIALWQPS
jgi:hypothetical protein